MKTISTFPINLVSYFHFHKHAGELKPIIIIIPPSHKWYDGSRFGSFYSYLSANVLVGQIAKCVCTILEGVILLYGDSIKSMNVYNDAFFYITSILYEKLSEKCDKVENDKHRMVRSKRCHFKISAIHNV